MAAVPGENDAIVGIVQKIEKESERCARKVGIDRSPALLINPRTLPDKIHIGKSPDT